MTRVLLAVQSDMSSCLFSVVFVNGQNYDFGRNFRRIFPKGSSYDVLRDIANINYDFLNETDKFLELNIATATITLLIDSGDGYVNLVPSDTLASGSKATEDFEYHCHTHKQPFGRLLSTMLSKPTY